MKIEEKETYNKKIDMASGIAVDLVAALYSETININYIKMLRKQFMKSDISIEVSTDELEYEVFQNNKIKFLRIENETLEQIIQNREAFSESVLHLERMKF